MEARPRLGRGLQRKEEGMWLWSRQRARLDGEVQGMVAAHSGMEKAEGRVVVADQGQSVHGHQQQ